jgi:toxin YoeB
MYSIEISSAALEDLKKIQKSGNKKVIDKVNQLILEIALNPREGTGKPEMLKNLVGEVWSRRINQKDRLVYSITENTVTVEVLSAMGHYK